LTVTSVPAWSPMSTKLTNFEQINISFEVRRSIFVMFQTIVY